MGKRGFTLLEMVVATTIMGIAVVGLLAGLSGAVRNAARLRDYDRAVQLAQLRMNEMLLDDRLPRNVDLQGAFDPSLSGGVESGQVALHLGVPVEKLEAKSSRLGVDSVGAANGGRALELQCAAFEHNEQRDQPSANHRGCLLHLQGLGGIDNVI